MKKQILIPFLALALFASVATSASAFGGNIDSIAFDELSVDLTNAQIVALEEAHSLRQIAHEDAQIILENAGIDQDTMREVRRAMHESQHKTHEAVRVAIESGDYQAFLTAVEDMPLAEIINSEADFITFVEAHTLREAGDYEGAQVLMEGLGVKRPEGFGSGGHRGGAHFGK